MGIGKFSCPAIVLGKGKGNVPSTLCEAERNGHCSQETVEYPTGTRRVYGDRISELLRILDLPEQSDEVLLAFGEGLNNTLAVSYKAAEMVREPPTLMDAVALAAGLEDITSSQTEI